MEYSKKRVINKAIPDNNPEGLLDTIVMHRDLTVRNVAVDVNIEHPYSGDISIILEGPNQEKVNLLNSGRTPGKNIQESFTGGNLSVFNGIKSKGKWQLKVVDLGAQDSGSLVDWALNFTLANSKNSEVIIKEDKDLKSAQYCHQGGVIKEMEVTVKLEHDHIGDIDIQLKSPTGTITTLQSRTGGGAGMFEKTFGADVLSPFFGEPCIGKWMIKISDEMPKDTGKLLSWGMWFKTGKAEQTKDDLKKIEGIGPKIEELLNNAGIHSFKQLSTTETNKIKDVLNEAGPRYQMHDPGSWPRQAQLAADGKWEQLEKLQDELDGGR